MLAVKNAKIFPVTSAPIANGTLLVDGGKIVAVGADVAIPAGAEVIDACGKVVVPGIVDAHAHLGLWSEVYGQAGNDGNEGGSPTTPEVSAVDSIYPDHVSFKNALRGGVTCAQTTPGSGNAIGGEMVVIKTTGKTVEDMIVRRTSGMKAALGENVKRWHGQEMKRAPKTRMGTAALIRQQFLKAKDYQRKLELAKDDPSKQPDTDIGMLNLIKVLNREVPLRIHAHRADDIVTAVRLAEEFNLDYSIEHCTDGASIAEFLGQRKAKVCIGPTLGARTKIETAASSFGNAAVLAKAGCLVSLITDHPFVAIQYIAGVAALTAANGLGEEEALKAITINPAINCGVADRVGSLEKGKDADFVIWSGHPFSIRSKVEQVFIDGKKVL